SAQAPGHVSTELRPQPQATTTHSSGSESSTRFGVREVGEWRKRLASEWMKHLNHGRTTIDTVRVQPHPPDSVNRFDSRPNGRLREPARMESRRRIAVRRQAKSGSARHARRHGAGPARRLTVLTKPGHPRSIDRCDVLP